MAPPNPPAPNSLCPLFDQFCDAFNAAQFDQVGQAPGLNDLVAPEASFTHIYKDEYQPTSALEYFATIMPPTVPAGPQITNVTRSSLGYVVFGDGQWTDNSKNKSDKLFFTFTYELGDDGTPWIVSMFARIAKKVTGRAEDFAAVGPTTVINIYNS
jgi:hypothetical protein